MPLYEFACNACGNRFERLSRTGDEPACPSCSSGDLKKLLSSFAVGRDAGPVRAPVRPSGGCGSCGDPRGPGACGMN